MKIYCIENSINNKKYIGLTTGTLENRFKKHKTLAKTNNGNHLHNAMKLYGSDNFFIYEIDTALNITELREKEKTWIKKLNTKSEGYNETDGGEGCLGWKATPEQRLANSLRNKKRMENPEYKEFIRQRTQEGMRNISPEAKQRMRDSGKSRIGNQHTKGKNWKLSEETKKRQSKPKSESHRKNIREALRKTRANELNPSFGSIWITNEKETIKLYDTSIIPDGWRRGRAFKERFKNVNK